MIQALRTTLSLLLVAAQSKGKDAWEYEVHEVIGHLIDLEDWSDEKKADLYALLIERVKANDTMLTIENHVEDCLRKNHGRYLNG